jgi:hypothetical protein
MDTHVDNNNNWDTELLKLIEQTSITGRFMFCNVYCSDDDSTSQRGGRQITSLFLLLSSVFLGFALSLQPQRKISSQK